MSNVYEAIGRVVVLYVRRRFGTQIRIALGVGLAGLLLGGYLAITRDVEEG